MIHQESKAQVWIDSGATWHYDYDANWWGGFYKLVYSQDSLINGQLCQLIETVVHTFGISAPPPDDQIVYFGNDTLDPNFTYVSGDTVFYLDNNEFFPLFSFGALIGDSWVISTTPMSGSMCNDTSRVEVIDTGHIVLNSSSYRYIVLQPTPNSPRVLSGIFVERFGDFGGSYGYHYLFPLGYNCDSMIIVEYSTFKFKCFEDNSFSLYNPSGEDCEYLLTHLDFEENVNSTFSVYPNPSSGNITIETSINESYQIDIYNLLGEMVSSFKVAGEINTIDVSDLSNGIYSVRLHSSEEHFETVKILIQN